MARFAIGTLSPREALVITQAATARGMDVAQYMDTILLPAAQAAVDAELARDMGLASALFGDGR
jgi:hypothetical protein